LFPELGLQRVGAEITFRGIMKKAQVVAIASVSAVSFFSCLSANCGLKSLSRTPLPGAVREIIGDIS
jgi:hypothetical protein